jgi:ABC-type transporter Mla MlaB component
VLKITPTQDNENSFNIRLCGELTKDYLPEIECLLNDKGSGCQTITLDLANVTFVDRDAMVFLCAAKTRNITVNNCPSYVTRWIQQERICGPSKK